MVYVVEAPHAVKVGITGCSVPGRLLDLERASGHELILVRSWETGGREHAAQVERDAHWLLRDTRTVGEWFICHPFEATAAVEAALRRGFPKAPLSVLADLEAGAA